MSRQDKGPASLKPNLTFAANTAVFPLVYQFLGFSHGSHVKKISLGVEGVGGVGGWTKRAGEGGGWGLNPPHTQKIKSSGDGSSAHTQ